MNKNSGCWSRDIFNFDFVEKGLEIASAAQYVYDFSRKMFLWCSINRPSFIFWLSLLLEILGNVCIALDWFPGCDVINFEINLIFLIKPFFCMTKKSRKWRFFSWQKKFSDLRVRLQSIHPGWTISVKIYKDRSRKCNL